MVLNFGFTTYQTYGYLFGSKSKYFVEFRNWDNALKAPNLTEYLKHFSFTQVEDFGVNKSAPYNLNYNYFSVPILNADKSIIDLNLSAPVGNYLNGFKLAFPSTLTSSLTSGRLWYYDDRNLVGISPIPFFEDPAFQTSIVGL